MFMFRKPYKIIFKIRIPAIDRGNPGYHDQIHRSGNPEAVVSENRPEPALNPIPLNRVAVFSTHNNTKPGIVKSIPNPDHNQRLTGKPLAVFQNIFEIVLFSDPFQPG